MKTEILKKEKLSDLEIIQEVLLGNSNAFSHLMKKYSPYFMIKFKNYLKVEADAEDVLMITMSKIFQNLDKFTPKYSLNSWISKIAHNTMIDFHKNKVNHGSKKTISIDNNVNSDAMKADSAEITYDILDRDCNPEEKMIKKEREDILDMAIDMLDNGSKNGKLYRDAIRLIYKEEKTYEEVSVLLDVGVTSLKPYVGRAKKQIEKNVKLILAGKGSPTVN